MTEDADGRPSAPPWSIFDWSPDGEPGYVHPVGTDADWDDLRRTYDPDEADLALDRVIEVCKAHGVRSVVVETRYVDLDYRSEFSAFYSTTFRRYPQVAHRLNFFTIPTDAADEDDPEELQEAYVGYSVMRPVPNGSVGRTMIRPPPELATGVMALSQDRVHLFGRELTISAAPFISQDGQYIRCAHASMWMALYQLCLTHGLPRCTPRDVVDASNGGEVLGRETPSQGLSVPQILTGLSRLGAAPLAYGLAELDEDDQEPVGLVPTICRYVNSRLPVILVSDSHAWSIVGYQRRNRRCRWKPNEVVLIRHDDEEGPYLVVEDPRQEPDPEHPLEIVVPVQLPKMYIGGSRAELVGRYWLERLANDRSVELGSLVDDAVTSDAISYRTYACSSVEFQMRTQDTGLPGVLGREYRKALWPRYLWVVEVVDRRLRERDQSAVIGEIILDATAHQAAAPMDTSLLRAIHIGDLFWRLSPDIGDLFELEDEFTLHEPYGSAAPAKRGQEILPHPRHVSVKSGRRWNPSRLLPSWWRQ